MAESGAAAVGPGRAESGGRTDGAGADLLLPRGENGVDSRAIRVGTRRSQVGSGRTGVRGVLPPGHPVHPGQHRVCVLLGAEDRPELAEFALFDSCRRTPGRSLESPSFGTQGTVSSVSATAVQRLRATSLVSPGSGWDCATCKVCAALVGKPSPMTDGCNPLKGQGRDISRDRGGISCQRATVGRSSLAKGDKRPLCLCAEIISFLLVARSRKNLVLAQRNFM